MSITAQKITDVVRLIDVVTKRGAFEGPELLSVGTLRDMLVSDAEELARAESEAEAAKREAEVEATAETPTRKVLGGSKRA